MYKITLTPYDYFEDDVVYEVDTIEELIAKLTECKKQNIPDDCITVTTDN